MALEHWVTLVPDTKSLEKGIKAAFDAAKKDAVVEVQTDPAQAEQAGREAGKAIDKGAKDATKDTGKDVGRQIDQTVTPEAAKTGNRAGTVLGGAFGASFGQAARTVGAQAGAILGKAMAGDVDGAVKDVTSALDGISGGLSTIQGIVGSDNFVGRGIGLLKNAVDNTKSSIGSLTGTVSSVASGVQAAQTTFSGLSSVVRLATGSQVGLNLALLANPIGLVVAGIAALVTGLVLFFTKTEVGRKIWEKFTEIAGKAWDWVKEKASAAWKWFESKLWPGIKTGVETAGKVFVSLRDTIGKVFNRIKEFIQPVLDMILKIKDVVGGVISGIGGVASKVGGFLGGIFKEPGAEDGQPIKVGGGLGDNIREVLTDDGPMNFPNSLGGDISGALSDAKQNEKGKREADREAKASERAAGQAQREADKQQARGLTPHAKSVQKMIKEIWPEITTIGGYRDPDGKFNEHSTGKALDVMIPNWNTPQGKALGDAVANWAMQNADDLGLSWVLWRQTQYGGSAGPGGAPMEDRGSDNDNHMNHVHIFMDGGKGGGGKKSGLKPSAGERISSAGSSAQFGGSGPVDPSNMPGFYAWVVPMRGDGAALGGGPLSGGGMGGGGTAFSGGGGAAGGGSDILGQLRGIGEGGAKESFLPGGFSDPTSWPNTKSGMALLNMFGNMLGGGGQQSGGLIEDTRNLAPGELNPAITAGGSASLMGGAEGMMTQLTQGGVARQGGGDGGQGNIDNSINFNGNVDGDVSAAMNRAKNDRVAAGRPLQTSAAGTSAR